MKPTSTPGRFAEYLSQVIALIILILPFHAFLTVWLSSAIGHYTLLRLWKEFLIALVLLGVIYLLIKSTALRQQLFASWLVRLIGVYFVLLLASGAIALARHTVTTKALAYGELLDLRFLGFFLMIWLVAAHSSLLKQNWRLLLILPATIVIIFGLLQYWFLPYDFLKHFGYGPATISPYETINNNIQHLRIESTLRGANPLGAYLVLVIAAAAGLLAATKTKRPSEYLWLLGALLALVFTFSRSAWIGTLLALMTIVWLAIKSARLKRRLLIIAAILVVVGGLLGLALRHNTTFEDAILHTDSQSHAAVSSNQGHTAAFENGIHDVVHQPLGEGVGTAGPASIYNNNKSRIAENYFLQIGQEAGILGMALFIAINILLGRELWLRRADPLALTLLASLIGISFVNMLSHAWTDDTLSYIWWGLAGVALAPAILKANKRKPNEKTIKKPA